MLNRKYAEQRLVPHTKKINLTDKVKSLINNYPSLYRPAIVLNGVYQSVTSKFPAQKTGRIGGTDSAEYCYKIFLQHLTKAFENGLEKIPARVAELGPGYSIGTGLCFILAGATEYYAFDVVEYADLHTNVAVFDELVKLFQDRNDSICPFPKHLLTDRVLAESLSSTRIDLIRNMLAKPRDLLVESGDSIIIKYVAPWKNYAGQFPNIDFFFSHTVLEHVDDLESTYCTMAETACDACNGGIISHVIDFTSHKVGVRWNEHWAFSDRVWKIIRGNQEYLINREPLSTHLALLKKYNFDIIDNEIINADRPSIERSHLKCRFKHMSDSDFTTQRCHILAKYKIKEAEE